MLTVPRYIHLNAVKAGIAQDVGEYPYSSYREYLEPREDQLTDVELVNGIMDIQPIQPRFSDERAKKLIEQVSGCETVEAFQALGKEKRTAALRQLKGKGMSYRQMSRLTGESAGIIQRVGRYGEPSHVWRCFSLDPHHR